MAMFPLFVELEGRQCLVVGGGQVAARKIATLLAYGAKIVVISPKLSGELLELKQQQALTHMERTYTAGDLEGAFLVIAATSDKEVNARIAAEALEKNIFANIADAADSCTFIFPSLVKKDQLVIGITTSGSYPALTKSLRKKLEDLLAGLDAETIAMLKKCRQRASTIKNPINRKELLNRIVEEAVFGASGERHKLIEQIFSEVEADEKID